MTIVTIEDRAASTAEEIIVFFKNVEALAAFVGESPDAAKMVHLKQTLVNFANCERRIPQSHMDVSGRSNDGRCEAASVTSHKQGERRE